MSSHRTARHHRCFSWSTSTFAARHSRRHLRHALSVSSRSSVTKKANWCKGTCRRIGAHSEARQRTWVSVRAEQRKRRSSRAPLFFLFGVMATRVHGTCIAIIQLYGCASGPRCRRGIRRQCRRPRHARRRGAGGRESGEPHSPTFLAPSAFRSADFVEKSHSPEPISEHERLTARAHHIPLEQRTYRHNTLIARSVWLLSVPYL